MCVCVCVNGLNELVRRKEGPKNVQHRGAAAERNAPLEMLVLSAVEVQTPNNSPTPQKSVVQTSTCVHPPDGPNVGSERETLQTGQL